MCRADSSGVFELPPGEESCCLYLNGPSGAIGILAATGLTGVTSNVGTFLGAGGLYSMISMFPPGQGDCPSPMCRSRSGECCLVVNFRGRQLCPVSCDQQTN